MASRQTANANSTSGFQYAAGTAGAAQIDIQLTRVFACENSAVAGTLANALVGTTIGGQTVGPIEVWVDGGVWDTTNNKFLRPVIDFDPSLLHRSGFGG